MKKKCRIFCSKWLVVLGCTSVLALLSAFAIAAPKGVNMKVSASVEEPCIIAVRVRHDMCPICKGLDPKFPAIIEKSKDSVLFVTLDLTNETTQKQAALLVGALGLERVWTGDMSKMGSVTFLDGTSKAILSFVQTGDIGEITASLRRAVKITKGSFVRP